MFSEYRKIILIDLYGNLRGKFKPCTYSLSIIQKMHGTLLSTAHALLSDSSYIDKFINLLPFEEAFLVANIPDFRRRVITDISISTNHLFYFL